MSAFGIILMLTVPMAAAEPNVTLYQLKTNCGKAGSGNIPPRESK